MKEWMDHIRIIREQLDALEEEGCLDGSPPAFLGHAKMIDGLDEMENGLRERDRMK